MFFIGAVLSGCAWWLIARLLGGDLFEDYKGLDAVGAIITGIVISYDSKPVYKRLRWKHLFWLTPLSIYLAVALFGISSFLSKFALIGPGVIGRSWSPGSGTIVHYEWPSEVSGLILAMWWGIIFTFYPAFLMSFLNHLIMRRLAKFNQAFRPTQQTVPQG